MPKLIANRPVLRMTSELGRVMAAAKRARAGRTSRHPPRARRARLRHAGAHRRGAGAAARAGRDALPGRARLAPRCARRWSRSCDARTASAASRTTSSSRSAARTRCSSRSRRCSAPATRCSCCRRTGWRSRSSSAFVDGARYRDAADVSRVADGHDGRRPSSSSACARALRPRRAGSISTRPTIRPAPCSPRAQLDALAAVAIERDLWVVSDEAYEHLLFDDAQHVSIGVAAGHGGAHGVSVFTFSKSYAMTGWRVGYARLAARAARADGPDPVVLLHPRRVPVGADRGARGDHVVAGRASRPCGARIRSAERCCSAGSRARSAIQIPPPRGAFYGFAEHSVARGEARHLGARRGVAVARAWRSCPGTAFGPEFGDWVRIVARNARRRHRRRARPRCAQHAGAAARPRAR